MGEQQILAMYDVRGIQNYIFRTSKLKDAIGASAVVEDIIEKALEEGVNEEKNLKTDIKWEDEKNHGPRKYVEDDCDVKVLYIGGGNAFVLYRDEALANRIGRRMSKYVLEKTYSLQLAIATTEKTGDYKADYQKINANMTMIKERMSVSKPIGALPIMQVEIKTGLPAVWEEDKEISRETLHKQNAEKSLRQDKEEALKPFDSFAEERGVDSMLAVVHIDGNNMGLRIRGLVQNITDYTEAVNKTRRISYNINHSYKEVFENMQNLFNQKDSEYKILKVLTAGDDITYVCRAKVAVASVEYFAREISKKGMLDDDSSGELKFSICGGISFMRSHFPFSISYEVAEACCESAKKRAKSNPLDGGQISNYFDFQYCQNVQARDMDTIREGQYRTSDGYKLMRRPYELLKNSGKYSFENIRKPLIEFSRLQLKEETSKQLPRSHAKELRNRYGKGHEEVEEFVAFLNSRNWKIPGAQEGLYMDDPEEKNTRMAVLYDALELMDDYVDLDEIEKKEAQNDNL